MEPTETGAGLNNSGPAAAPPPSLSPSPSPEPPSPSPSRPQTRIPQALLWIAAAAVVLRIVTVVADRPKPDGAGLVAWKPFADAAALSQQAGKPVLYDFTAAWCVTCQVNKRVALHNASVVSAFAAHDVVTLKADWTRQDPLITTTLAALGRNAVPVYALYVPGESEPRLLPEVLTPSLVLDEISRLPAARVASVVEPKGNPL